MGDFPTQRVLVCGTLIAGGVAVAAGCPILGGLAGAAMLNAAGGLASNILATDIFNALQSGGFDPQANFDTRRAIGRAMGDALKIEAGQYRYFSVDRRGLTRLAQAANNEWVNSENIDGAFGPLHEENAVRWFTSGLDETTGRPPAVFDRPEPWQQVLGELSRLANRPTKPSQAALAAAAQHLHERFPVLLRNVIKGDPNQAGSNRAFVALQLDFMRLLMGAQRKILEKLEERHELDGKTFAMVKQIRDAIPERARVLETELDPAAQTNLRRVSDDINQFAKEFDAFAADVSSRLRGIERRQIADRAAADTANTLTHGKLDEAIALIRQALNDKPAPAAPDQPPPVSPEVREAAATVERSKEASLVQRAEAAIVSRSPDALAYLDQVDRMAEQVEFRRHQLRGDYHYFRGEYDQAVKPYEDALKLHPNDLKARNAAAVAHNQARLNSIADHQRRAIEIYLGSLTLVPPGSLDWAMTQNNLGNAWRDMPTGDRGKNLAKAVAAYEAALTVRTRDAAPADWAATQNNLGIAWRNMPAGDRGKNLAKAVAAYEAALTVRTRDAAPADWAATQNNLGAAWADMPTGDRGKNLAKAVAAYEAALTVYTKDAAPADWAMTQNNLGNAWATMPTGDRGKNLAKAVAAFEAALTVRTRDAAPADWAATQNNLGAAWRNMPTGDRGKNLAKAVAAYEAALTVRTRDAAPADWAATQNNLGNAWRDMPTGDRGKNLAKAVAAFEAALTVYTKDATPAEWATTQNNLAIALAYLAELPGRPRCELLRRAVACGKGALTVRTADAFPADHDATNKVLSVLRAAYESGGCDADVPFDAIEPAT